MATVGPFAKAAKNGTGEEDGEDGRNREEGGEGSK